MALDLIRLVWGNPPVPAGRWHGGLLNLKAVPRGAALSAHPAEADPWRAFRLHRVHLSLRGALLWTLAVALLLHLVGAFVLQRRFAQSSTHNRVTYADLAFPWRWRTLDRLRGEALIADGRVLLREKRVQAGLALLRQGIARHPGDSEARLELARLYAAMRLAPLARKTLRDGLAHGYLGREGTSYALALAVEADAPAERVELCRLSRERFAALPAAGRAPAESAWLDLQLALALRADGRAAEALAILRSAHGPASPLRLEAETLAALEAGAHAEAAALAGTWAAASPRDPEPLRLLADARLAAGDLAAAEDALARLRSLEPHQPRPLLFAYERLRARGHHAAALAKIDELVLRQGSRPALYDALAAIIGTGDDALLARIERESAERGLSPRPALRARLRVAVARRDWPAALDAVDRLGASPGPAFDPRERAWLATMERLARACLDGASGVQASLVEIVADHPGTLRLYRTVVEALLDSGRPATARRVLALAEGPLPDSVTLAALRARAEAAATPAVAPLGEDGKTARADFADERLFTAACAARTRRGELAEALASIAELRRARPDWLADAETRIDVLELGLRARGDDGLRLQFLARAVLAREPAGADRLLALARGIHAENPAWRSNALILVREIARLVPDHADALAQLADWEPSAGHEPGPET